MARAAGLVLAALLLAQPPRDAPRTHAEPPLANGTIHGRVVADDTGEPLHNARIAVAPDADVRPVLTDAEGRDRWYPGSRFVVAIDAGRNGAFAGDGFAAADYYVAAVDKRRFIDVKGETENAEFLESLVANATRVTLAAGQRATIALTVAR